MTQTFQNHNVLYHDSLDVRSHVMRMLVAYKGIQVELIAVGADLPTALLDINPYGSTPTWIDREVVVYDMRCLFEYLEERYPAPSLLPPVPAVRAQVRMLCHRMEKDWLTRIAQLSLRDKAEVKPILQYLSDGLTSLSPLFEKHAYFMSDTMTLADCYLLAILWRLPGYGVELSKNALPLVKYAQRMFKESFFQESLTPQERALYASPTQTRTTL